MNEGQSRVVSYYDAHHLTEEAILRAVRKAGKDPEHIGPQDLFPFDQNHYGGLEANDALAALLKLDASSHVLDICSGLGGPARYMAWRFGCQVVGVELNEARVAGAVNLTRLAGLRDKVSFVQGDASAPEFPPERFGAAYSQEAFLHIPDKAALFAGCHRVLKRGGRLAFTDWVARPSLTNAERDRLKVSTAAVDIASAEEFLGYLERAGFREGGWEDLTDMWLTFLCERAERLKAMDAEAVALFGPERHRAFTDSQFFIVDLIENGRLTGGRFHAVKA
jgi:sarcosine/dimethylglycine N-methyltransferase